jgi:hypothetical protein
MYSKINRTKVLTLTVLIATALIFSIVPHSSVMAASKHGDARDDPKGKPVDPNHFGEESSQLAQDDSGRGLGDHAGNFDVVGQPPFDSDGQKGRIGVGNNFGDGPSGHAACLDGDPSTTDPGCPNGFT